MMSAVRVAVARSRSLITSMTARCVSRVDMPAALEVSTSLISTWWFHRLASSREGLV